MHFHLMKYCTGWEIIIICQHLMKRGEFVSSAVRATWTQKKCHSQMKKRGQSPIDYFPQEPVDSNEFALQIFCVSTGLRTRLIVSTQIISPLFKLLFRTILHCVWCVKAISHARPSKCEVAYVSLKRGCTGSSTSGPGRRAVTRWVRSVFLVQYVGSQS